MNSLGYSDNNLKGEWNKRSGFCNSEVDGNLLKSMAWRFRGDLIQVNTELFQTVKTQGLRLKISKCSNTLNAI